MVIRAILLQMLSQRHSISDIKTKEEVVNQEMKAACRDRTLHSRA